MSGVLKNDATLTNFNRNSQERLQHVQVMQGKTAAAVNELHAGDLGRGGQAEGNHHGRNARRQERADLLSAGAHSRAFDYLRDRAEDAGR